MIKQAKYSTEEYHTLTNQQPELKLLSILPSLKCDARCIFCPIWGKNGWAFQQDKESVREQLNITRLGEFITDALEHTKDKFFWVVITGGEPFLYDNIIELLQFLRRKLLPVILYTNGSQVGKYLDQIIDHIVTLTFSIDGPPAVHDDVRKVKNLFDTACENIENILKLKKRRQSFFPMLRINYVVSQYNIDHIPEFVEAIERRFKLTGAMIKYDADFVTDPNSIIVNFDPLQFTSTELGNKYTTQMKKLFYMDISSAWQSMAEDSLAIDVEQTQKYLQMLWDNSGTDSSDFVDLDQAFHNIHNTFGRTRCLTPWNELFIRQDGGVYFCPHNRDYSFGNIYNSSFREIWDGELANQFRKQLSKGLLSICNRCCRLYSDYNFQKLGLPVVSR